MISLRYIFVAAFGGGLVGLVVAMLRGVERIGSEFSGDSTQLRITLPTASAFAVGAGAAGFGVSRSNLSSPAQVLTALTVGAAVMLASVALIARSAATGSDPHLATELFQGQPAIAVSEITDTITGEITYLSDDTTMTFPATSLMGNRITAGTEVVIDRIEQGIAYVEEWSAVEGRL